LFFIFLLLFFFFVYLLFRLLPVLREVLAVDGAPCALFVDAADTPAFAAAVARALHEPVRQSLMNAGRRLSERYPLDAMIDQFMTLLEGATP
jgi:glycosyltransferase involved in cell wall biosynthesis